MLLTRYLSSIILNVSMLSNINCDPFDGPIPQDRLKYSYEDYWSQDTKTCIVSDVNLSNDITNMTFLAPEVPSIEHCDGKYVISNQKLILPRNTLPICEYTPTLYDSYAKGYAEVYVSGFKNGNSTFEAYLKECLDGLKVTSKARVEQQYDVNIHNTTCTRYSDFLTITYGKTPEITSLVDKAESLISSDIKWNNSKLQANIFASTVCFGVNKQGCASILEHLLNEKDNSSLNLLGFNINQTPTTWLYSDGIDTELLHNVVEIMGMELETRSIDNINYHNIKRECSSAPYEFIKRKPGLLGGFPKY